MSDIKKCDRCGEAYEPFFGVTFDEEWWRYEVHKDCHPYEKIKIDLENSRVFHSYGYDEGYKDGYAKGYKDGKVLDEIRAEIDSALSGALSEELPNDVRTQISDVGIGLEIALKIIDKHRKEDET